MEVLDTEDEASFDKNDVVRPTEEVQVRQATVRFSERAAEATMETTEDASEKPTEEVAPNRPLPGWKQCRKRPHSLTHTHRQQSPKPPLSNEGPRPEAPLRSRNTRPSRRGPVELCGRRVPFKKDQHYLSSGARCHTRFVECRVGKPRCLSVNLSVTLGVLRKSFPTGAMSPKKKEEMSTDAEFFFFFKKDLH